MDKNWTKYRSVIRKWAKYIQNIGVRFKNQMFIFLLYTLNIVSSHLTVTEKKKDLVHAQRLPTFLVNFLTKS